MYLFFWLFSRFFFLPFVFSSLNMCVYLVVFILLGVCCSSLKYYSYSLFGILVTIMLYCLIKSCSSWMLCCFFVFLFCCWFVFVVEFGFDSFLCISVWCFLQTYRTIDLSSYRVCSAGLQLVFLGTELYLLSYPQSIYHRLQTPLKVGTGLTGLFPPPWLPRSLMSPQWCASGCSLLSHFATLRALLCNMSFLLLLHHGLNTFSFPFFQIQQNFSSPQSTDVCCSPPHR
jgi:hypothetical protein